MVIEVFNSIPKNAGIKRKEMGEPFGPDPRIPVQYQHTFEDYTEYCKLGGSFGHNAAAFLHKASEREYRDTFLFSNISPQEIVLNTGLWLLFEHVSEEIIRKYQNAIIINGCTQGNRNSGKVLTLGNGTKMAVPSIMYKIILYQKNRATSDSSDGRAKKVGATSDSSDGRAKKVGASHYLCFVAENRPYYIDQEFTEAFRKHQRFDLSRYTHSLSDFLAKFPLPGIDPKSMVFDPRDAAIMTNKFRHDQIMSSTLYGKIIYSRSMEELQRVAPNPAELKGFLLVFYQYALERLQGSSQGRIMTSI